MGLLGEKFQDTKNKHQIKIQKNKIQTKYRLNLGLVIGI